MANIHKWASGKFGIGFWAGAGVYSLINLIMNFNHISQDKILNYNYMITGVAIIGLILNMILLKRKETKVNTSIRMLLSLPIGVVAMGIAKFVHPSWSITYLLLFGLLVFAVTFVISLLVKKSKI
jgi:hypothetical protein